MNLAPVIVFAYKRPDHLSKCLDALMQNNLSEQTDVIVFSDAAKTTTDLEGVSAVRRLLKSVAGFRSFEVIEQDANCGLAKSISQGVSQVVSQYGRAIIVEDDIICAPHFLQFMNDALEKYADDARVWHVSGWGYPIHIGQDSAFWEVMNCWGWATWEDRWCHFSKDPQKLVTEWNASDIKKFNLDGAHNFWIQVEMNSIGKLDTWAVFWYATIFENDGLCLNPVRSLVANIGHDGSGENCEFETSDVYELSDQPVGLPAEVKASSEFRRAVISHYISSRQSLPSRVMRKLRTKYYRWKARL